METWEAIAMITALIVVVILVIFGILWAICIDVPAGSQIKIVSTGNLSSIAKANTWLSKSTDGSLTGTIPPYQFVTLNPDRDVGAQIVWAVYGPDRKTFSNGTLNGDNPMYIWAWPAMLFGSA